MSVASGPNVVSNGLALTLDAANPKSYSTNVFTYPLDGFAWAGPGGGHQMTLTRDSSVTDSPVGGIPLKIVTSGSSAYTGTYNAPMWNLAPAASGQTWTFSFYVKGTTAHTASLMIFEANSSGNYTTLGQYFYNVTTSWTRVSGSYTMSQATTAYVQVRIDDYNTGVTIWVDGLQLERTNAITTFNSKANLNGVNWYDVSGTDNKGTLVSTPGYSTSNLGSFTFNNIATQSTLIQDSATIKPTSVTISAWVYMSVYNPLGDFDGSYPTIVWKTNDGLSGSQASYGLTLVAGQVPRLTIAPSVIISATVFPLNVWVNLVGTYTAGSGAMILYRNGEVDTTGTGPAAISYSTELLSVGTRTLAGASQYPWNGNISQVTLYNRVLSAAEVAQNFNALRGRYGV
jgi:hypothetical protein